MVLDMSDGWASPSGDPQQPNQPPYGDRPPPRYGAYGPVPAAPPPPPQQGGPHHYNRPQQGGPHHYNGPQQGGPHYYNGPQQVAPMAPKPGVVPLRPLALGDIFNGAFATIRGNPGATLGLSLIVHLIVAVPSLLLTLWLKKVSFADGLNLEPKSDGSPDSSLLTFDLITPIAQIFTYLGGIVLAGMIVVVVSDAVLGRRITMGETWTRIRPRIWALLGMTALLVLAMLLAVAIVVGVVVLAAVAVGTALAVVLGVVLGLALLVGLIAFYVRVTLASPALVLENLGPIAAIRRSWGLTHGAFWRVFGITLLASLVAGFIGGFAGLPASFMTLGGFATSGVASVLLLVGAQLWSAVVSAAVAPFVSGTTGLLYIDQRMRKEGLDVTLMSAAAPDGHGKG